MNPAEFANIARVEQDFWWYRGMRRILYRLLDSFMAQRPGAQVLEGGCGTGYNARDLEARYGCTVFPIDLGWNGLQHARTLGVRRLAQADISRIPYPNGQFDVVASIDVIVHFPRGEEQAALGELVRVLKPGGLFVLRVSALDILRSHHSIFVQERQRFTQGRLARVVRQNGVRILRHTYVNSLLLPVSLLKFRVWEPLSGQQPDTGVAPMPGWLNWALEQPLRLEAGWVGVGGNFPLGQSLVLIGQKDG